MIYLPLEKVSFCVLISIDLHNIMTYIHWDSKNVKAKVPHCTTWGALRRGLNYRPIITRESQS